MKPTTFLIAAAVLTSVPVPAVHGQLAQDLPAQTNRVDGVAAVVQGDPIFESEVEEQLYLFLLQSGSRPDSVSAEGMRMEILDRLIDEKLIVQEAEKKNVSIPDSDIDAQVDAALVEAKQRLGGEGGYQAELAREGITESQLRNRYRGEIRRQALANQLLRSQIDIDLEISQTESELYYEEHKDEFPRYPAEYRLAVIQIAIEPEKAELDKSRQRAENALARVKSGESFTRVAQEVSEDPNTRNAGGDLGFFGRGQLDPIFEATAFSLSPGEISDIVLTPFGFHIIRVEEVDETSGEVHARHMLFQVPLTPEDQQRAESRANKVHAEALSGADFAILITKHSDYGGPQGGGGDLGFMPAAEFSPNIRTALEPLQVGEISAPEVSPQGYVIFKMLDRRAEREYELAEIKDQLPELVRRIKLQSQYENWVASLRNKAHIEVMMQ